VPRRGSDGDDEGAGGAGRHSVLAYSDASPALYLVSWVLPDAAAPSESARDSDYTGSSPALTARQPL
jgi:hypothetical protein